MCVASRKREMISANEGLCVTRSLTIYLEDRNEGLNICGQGVIPDGNAVMLRNKQRAVLITVSLILIEESLRSSRAAASEWISR